MGVSAVDHLKNGDLAAALAVLQEDVRKAPSEAKHRIFLFQLLAVMGDWNRALTQLRLCAQLDAAAIPMAQTYREAIGCELVRERVFRGETAPLVFGEPQQWIALLFQALGALARGDGAAASALRAEAFEAAPATAGTVNGKPFAWIADADTRFGPVLEVIVNGRYYWAPFAAVKRIVLEEPVDLRDRVWTPATITWANGGEVPALIPTRYPGVTAETPDELRFARATEWEDLGDGTYAGRGQRIFATDAEDIAIMDVRQIALESVAPEPAGSETGAGEGESADG
jgi:type VI secretion system protein ImpE